jgi:hypothetical protein
MESKSNFLGFYYIENMTALEAGGEIKEKTCNNKEKESKRRRLAMHLGTEEWGRLFRRRLRLNPPRVP